MPRNAQRFCSGVVKVGAGVTKICSDENERTSWDFGAVGALILRERNTSIACHVVSAGIIPVRLGSAFISIESLEASLKKEDGDSVKMIVEMESRKKTNQCSLELSLKIIPAVTKVETLETKRLIEVDSAEHLRAMSTSEDVHSLPEIVSSLSDHSPPVAVAGESSDAQHTSPSAQNGLMSNDDLLEKWEKLDAVAVESSDAQLNSPSPQNGMNSNVDLFENWEKVDVENPNELADVSRDNQHIDDLLTGRTPLTTNPVTEIARADFGAFHTEGLNEETSIPCEPMREVFSEAQAIFNLDQSTAPPELESVEKELKNADDATGSPVLFCASRSHENAPQDGSDDVLTATQPSIPIALGWNDATSTPGDDPATLQESESARLSAAPSVSPYLERNPEPDNTNAMSRTDIPIVLGWSNSAAEPGESLATLEESESASSSAARSLPSSALGRSLESENTNIASAVAPSEIAMPSSVIPLPDPSTKYEKDSRTDCQMTDKKSNAHVPGKVSLASELVDSGTSISEKSTSKIASSGTENVMVVRNSVTSTPTERQSMAVPTALAPLAPAGAAFSFDRYHSNLSASVSGPSERGSFESERPELSTTRVLSRPARQLRIIVRRVVGLLPSIRDSGGIFVEVKLKPRFAGIPQDAQRFCTRVTKAHLARQSSSSRENMKASWEFECSGLLNLHDWHENVACNIVSDGIFSTRIGSKTISLKKLEDAKRLRIQEEENLSAGPKKLRGETLKLRVETPKDKNECALYIDLEVVKVVNQKSGPLPAQLRSMSRSGGSEASSVTPSRKPVTEEPRAILLDAMKLERQRFAAKLSAPFKFACSVPILRPFISKHIPSRYTKFSGSLGHIMLQIIEARDLPETEPSRNNFEACDSFVVVKSGRYWFRTLTVNKSSDPVWNLESNLDVEDPGQQIYLMVFSNSTLIGAASFSVSAINPFAKKTHDLWIPLRDEIQDIRPLSEVEIKGYLHLRVEWRLDDVYALFYSYLQKLPCTVSELFGSSREEMTPILESARIPVAAYDVASPSKEVQKTLATGRIQETARAFSQNVLAPVYMAGTVWKNIASCRNPALSLLALFFYELCVFSPGMAAKHCPLLAILVLMSSYGNTVDMRDKEPPPRLPRAKNRRAQTASEPDENAAPKRPRQIGIFRRLGLLKDSSTPEMIWMEDWVETATRLSYLFSWGSPSGTLLLVFLLALLYILLLVFPLRWIFALLPVVAISLSTTEMHPLLRVLLRMPRHAQSFLVHDRQMM